MISRTVRSLALLSIPLVALGCESQRETSLEETEPNPSEVRDDSPWRRELADFKQETQTRLGELESRLERGVEQGREEVSEVADDVRGELGELRQKVTELSADTREEWHEARADIRAAVEKLDRNLDEKLGSDEPEAPTP